MTARLGLLRRAFFGALLACAASCVLAQGYPARGVRMIVPQPPGGQVDTVSRMLGQKLTEQWGQPVIVENRPGGGTVVCTQAIAKAVPDGYTFGMVLPALVINPTLRTDLPYDTQRDFTYLTLLGASTLALVAHPSLPANNVKELLDLAKSQPGSVEYASLGVGNTTHLAGELLNHLAGTRMVHVPYNGSPPAYQDMLAGRVKLGFVTLQSAMPHVKAGRLRLLGIASAGRSAVYPDLPLVAETVKGFNVDSFMGFVAPAGIPAEAASRLSAELVRAIRADSVRTRLIEFGIEPMATSPAEFDAFVRQEIVKWRPIIKSAGLKPE